MKRICLVLAILAAFALGYADRPVYDVDMSLQISQSLYGRKSWVIRLAASESATNSMAAPSCHYSNG